MQQQNKSMLKIYYHYDELYTQYIKASSYSHAIMIMHHHYFHLEHDHHLQDINNRLSHLKIKIIIKIGLNRVTKSYKLVPWKINCDSSIIFQTLIDLSRAPQVTHLSLFKLSILKILSWWPYLKVEQNMKEVLNRKKKQRQKYKQCFNISHFINTPKFYRTIKWRTV
jgi:hypothetical protein